jgi:tRNA pseudouridine13 synthase
MKLKQVPEDFIVREKSSIEPGKEGDYTYFRLKKTNFTTLLAMNAIANAVNAELSNFGCAGNKDKIAVTEQVCSVKGVSPESLAKVSINGIEVKPLGKGNKPVSLGDLKANEFEITVREIEKRPETKNRFLNLFGEQRFSTHNAAIGKAIVKRDFKQAVALILITKSIAAMKIHEILAFEPKNYIGALRSIPLRLLKLYVHAYQSELWNGLAKKHAETHHDNTKMPIVGFGTVPDRQLEEIMKREGITARDFVIKEFPELSSEGTERDVFADASDLKIGELENDELNPDKKKLKLTFSLPKGSYATEFVRQLFS